MLEERLKRALVVGAGYTRMIRRVLHPKLSVPWRTSLRMWRHGMVGETSVIYDFANNGFDDYLSDVRMHTKAIRINTDYNPVLNNKLVLSCLIGSQVRVPRVYSIIKRGRFIPFDMEVRVGTTDELIEVCRRLGAVVLKPNGMGSGAGFCKLEHVDGEILLNKEPIGRGQLDARIASMGDHLVSQFVEQGEYARKVYPRTTNTVKMLTMVDPQTVEPFIVIAAQRFGSDRSFPIDSFLAGGGLSAEINTDDGTIGRAASVKGKILTWHETHPDTGEPILGLKIPRWEQARDAILRMVRTFSFIRYATWDVVVQDDGLTVIEGNANPGMAMLQVHRPLLGDPRVRAFYEYHKVV